MSAGGKGDKQRPTDSTAYSAGYDRIFGQKTMGCSSTAEQGALTASVAGSNPATPATYVDDDTGQKVTEAWWPGDPISEQAHG